MIFTVAILKRLRYYIYDEASLMLH